MEWTDTAYIQKILQKRKRDAHKGDFGKVLIFAGSLGMAGAAVLCARAALKSGAGLVQFLLPDFTSPLLPILQTAVPEATCTPVLKDCGCAAGDADVSRLPLREGFCLSDYTAIACGSGLGQGTFARTMLAYILENYAGVLLLDADALNMIAASEELAEKTRACRARVILTPHIGEARRLLHTNAPIQDPQSRLQAAEDLAAEYRCIAVLKGAGTLVAYTVASPASVQIFQNTTGNPGMATAGSGDSLAGLITSLAAQGYAPPDAARMGVFLHGRAGDLAAKALGEMGVTASDIVFQIPFAIKSYVPSV